MKRATAAWVIVMLVVVATGVSAAKTKISVGIQWDIQVFNGVFPAMADAYMGSHPDVEVEILQGWGNEKIFVAAAGGALPDIVFGWGRTKEFQEVFLPLDALMRTKGIRLSDYLPGASSQMTIGGKTWVLQMFIDPNFPLMYNKTLMAESGLDANSPPRTVVEFDTMFPKLMRRGVTGGIERIAMPVWLSGYHSAGLLYSWSAAFGARLWEGTEKEGQFGLSSPRMVAALEWLAEHQQRYASDAAPILGDGRGAITRLTKGLQVMSYEVTPYLKHLRDANVMYEWGAAPPIYEEQHGFRNPIWFGGWPAGVTQQSKSPETAFDFLAFMAYDAEGQRIMAGVGELFPGVKNSVGYRELVKKDPTWMDFIQALNASDISAPSYYIPIDWGAAFEFVWNEVFVKRGSPQAALLEAQRLLEADAREKGIAVR